VGQGVENDGFEDWDHQDFVSVERRVALETVGLDIDVQAPWKVDQLFFVRLGLSWVFEGIFEEDPWEFFKENGFIESFINFSEQIERLKFQGYIFEFYSVNDLLSESDQVVNLRVW
jgi:hypothetical protein